MQKDTDTQHTRSLDARAAAVLFRGVRRRQRRAAAAAAGAKRRAAAAADRRRLNGIVDWIQVGMRSGVVAVVVVVVSARRRRDDGGERFGVVAACRRGRLILVGWRWQAQRGVVVFVDVASVTPPPPWQPRARTRTQPIGAHTTPKHPHLAMRLACQLVAHGLWRQQVSKECFAMLSQAFARLRGPLMAPCVGEEATTTLHVSTDRYFQ